MFGLLGGLGGLLGAGGGLGGLLGLLNGIGGTVSGFSNLFGQLKDDKHRRKLQKLLEREYNEDYTRRHTDLPPSVPGAPRRNVNNLMGLTQLLDAQMKAPPNQR